MNSFLSKFSLKKPETESGILSAAFWLDFVKRNQRILQPLMFFGGFTYDSLTMVRVDNLIDNIFFFAYLLLLSAIMILQIRLQANPGIGSWLARYFSYFPLAAQFMIGAMMSGFLIYYFQSAADAKAFLFVLIIVALLIGNEFLEKRYEKIGLLFVLYFFCLFSFLLFFIPTVSKKLNHWSFVLALIFALMLTLLLWIIGNMAFHRSAYPAILKKPFLGVILTLSLLLALLYHQNWIPPVPLSLKSIGVYKSVVKENNEYRLSYTPNPWYLSWRNYNATLYYRPGDQMVCFASVFAPGGLEEKIIHNWQIFDEQSQSWLDVDRIEFKMIGGRDGGYRGFTQKSKLKPGNWRVRILNEENKLIGKVHFSAVNVDSMFQATEIILY
ncbi:MAG TPA: DUF2914 domain-containing protein [Candidatus Marinimicrobia bacterium]|nr:DUF2914 domain-containing protein [Candidatus Neomarinimicrobiota bacterium]